MTKKKKVPLEPKVSINFWTSICSVPSTHNTDATKLQPVKKQNHIIITQNDLKKYVIRLSNCKAPEPDQVQGFWFKRIIGLHEAIVKHLQTRLASGKIPPRMVKGRTILNMKDETKDNIPSKDRPITSLPVT